MVVPFDGRSSIILLLLVVPGSSLHTPCPATDGLEHRLDRPECNPSHHIRTKVGGRSANTTTAPSTQLSVKIQAGLMHAGALDVASDGDQVMVVGTHAMDVQTLAACGVTMCLVFVTVLGWLGHYPLDIMPTARDDAGREMLLDNAKVWAVALVIWGHIIYYNLGYDAYTTYHDNLTWLKGFHGLGKNILEFISAVYMPTVCFISGYLSKGAPSIPRTRRYVQFLLIPTLIWVFFAKPVIMEIMMKPSMELLQAKLIDIAQLVVFHCEWYLQALCIWRASAFLIWYHLRPSVSLACMLFLSCASGYANFTGVIEQLKLAEALGFLPYFAAGYTFPKDRLHALASWRTPKTVSTALLFVVIWIEMVIPLLAQGVLPDAHGPYTCCEAGEVFTRASAHSISHSLYWTRRLSKFCLEMVPTMVMIMFVTPHGEMWGFSWIGPHTIYPFVFHEVANHWRDRLIQVVGPPVITSTSGHVLVLLLHIVWALAVMALFSSSIFRRTFAWCFNPTWTDPLFNIMDVSSDCPGRTEKAWSEPQMQRGSHPSKSGDSDADGIEEVSTTSHSDTDGVAGSSLTSADRLSGKSGSEASLEALAPMGVQRGDFPRFAEAMPWMRAARPFYPVLMPLYAASLALPILAVVVGQFLGLPSLAKMFENLCQLPLPILCLTFSSYAVLMLMTYYWHAGRFCNALEPSNRAQFAGSLSHVVVVLAYQEPLSVLRRTFASIASQTHLGKRPTVVLACEARDASAARSFQTLQSEFATSFEDIMFTQHVLLPGELPGKSSNENFAVREVYGELVDDKGLDPFSIMITICDADSLFSPLYLNQVEAAFWHQRDGRRLIYSAPLNTYRNLSSGGLLTQMYEMLRSHHDAFFGITRLYQPQSNYSLTLGFVKEIDFWTPDNIPEDVHTCRRAQVNNFCSMTTVPVAAYIVNDLVEDLPDRYVQAKRHRWGVTEIAWVFGLYHHMPFHSWVHLLCVELSVGTFREEVELMLRFVFQIWLLASMWSERHSREYGPGLKVIAIFYVFSWVLFWLGELSLWKKPLSQFAIEKPSLLSWTFLVVLGPVLKPLTDIIFHIVPTLDCLIHVTFRGELVYVNAPKGTEQDREELRHWTQ